MIVHLLFEQSGTFKREFMKLEYTAYDYDIDDLFGNTDFKIDLFKEIDNATNGVSSIFDNFKHDDLIFAFFPCIRFTDSVLLQFRCDAPQMKKWSVDKKLSYSMKLNKEQSEFYQWFCNLFKICLDRNLKLIVENPYNAQSYLNMAFPIRPSIVHLNRILYGDVYKKPTQYWFINLEPKKNKLKCETEFNFGGRPKVIKKIQQVSGIDRSLMSFLYARNFIEKYII